MTKVKRRHRPPCPPKPDDKIIREAFEKTAQAIGSDMLQVCAELDEELVMYRESVCDYLYIHGGKHGKTVSDWVMHPDGATENYLNDIGIPDSWR